MPCKDGEVTPELLMEDVEFTLAWREKLAYEALTRDDWRILFSVFSTTDRVQHMMYQYYDPLHPMYDAEEAAKSFSFFGEDIPRSEAIPAIYRQMDRVVGEVLDRLRDDDVLMVVSDHGFQSFRRQVHVNNWLEQAGFLVTKPCLSKSDSKGLAFVDWEQTRAYSLGMGFVYLNLEGREPNGIVKPSEADALLAEIRASFLATTDPEAPDQLVGKDAYVTREIHTGAFLEDEADLLLGFAGGYRVSWASTFGGMPLERGEDGCMQPATICVDNDKNWSGGHVSVALPDVAGVFFSNRAVDVPNTGIGSLQIAATTLALTGVEVPLEMDQPPLVVR
jgi:predicted AlkP superfamily phosphohydrolase/phosphomutase